MPVGSNSEDVGNQGRFRKYASFHAENWYRYVNITRERDAKNGDVRLVIGYDKTSLWGIATFSDSTEEDSVLLEFQPVDETSVGRTYEWKHSGTAEVRSGPGAKEVEDLRRGDSEQGGQPYENQCLFVRTLNVTLGDKTWAKLAGEFGEIETNEGYTKSQTSPMSSQSSMGSTSTSSQASGSTSTPGDISGACAALSTLYISPIDQKTNFPHVSHLATALV